MATNPIPLPEPIASPDLPELVDVLIVGAGISGIDAAYRLQTECPERNYAIVEARSAIGGTWDLFRYPGVRSDSDMATLGFPFRPWRGDEAIADGEAIRRYVVETAEECGIAPHIRFGWTVVEASWSSARAEWTVVLAHTDSAERTDVRCRFLYLCAGYYDYAAGYAPDMVGIEEFGGRIIHPQHWPEGLALGGKRVVVVGSGATAVTLIPAIAREAAHVTMLQRSPSYVVARPRIDRGALALRRRLPGPLADAAVRWRSILTGMFFYGLARWRPAATRNAILQGVRWSLGERYDVDRDFAPRYAPWDERMCLAPDGDLFATIREGHASVATGEIERITRTGVTLRSGETLPADIIVMATGLTLRAFGGVTLVVDGERQELPAKRIYKGLMLSGVPNLAFAFGYTNASWTLRCDLAARYVCRLLNHMGRHALDICRPSSDEEGRDGKPMVGLMSGYVRRSAHLLPRQGRASPWRLHQNYLSDVIALRFGRVADGVLQFGKKGR